MQFLNKLSRKNMVKAVLCGVIATGCVVGLANDASAATLSVITGAEQRRPSDKRLWEGSVGTPVEIRLATSSDEGGKDLSEAFVHGVLDSEFASGGQVIIKGGNVGSTSGVTPGGVYGGKTITINYSANFNDPKSYGANFNTVTISGGKIGIVWGGGATIGTANKNVVTVSGGTVSGDIFGGESLTGASENIVNILGGTVSDIYGGRSSGNACKNIVNISGNTVYGDVYGGHNNNESSYYDIEVKENVVNIVGKSGVLENAVIGYNADGTSVIGSIVGKKKEISISGVIYGGYVKASNAVSVGNALNIYGIDTIVDNIADFQKMQFTLNAGDNKGKNMLYIDAEGNADTVLKNVESIAVTAAPGAKLAKDAKVNLIHKTDSGALKILAGTEESSSIFDENGKAKADYAKLVVVSSPLRAASGELSIDKLDSDKKMNDLVFTAKENITVGANGGMANNVKSTVETRANAVALLNEAADFFLEQGLVQAKTAAKASDINGRAELAPFAAVGGSSMRYKTGSHVDSNSWHGAIGVSKQVGDLVYGVAVEHGKSNYDSYVGNAHGEGKSKATGGAVFAEIKKDSGVHYDVAVRAGSIKNDYVAYLSFMGIGTNVDYKESSTYYGLSFGAGKEFILNEKDVVDLYGRYYWTHTNSADVTTNLNDEINFDAVNSHRTRLGTRYTHAVNDISKLYAGIAWQYEFSCKAKATVNGYNAPAPGLKGHSGMLEIGWKAQAGKNLSIDVNASGYIGKQKGVSGSVGLEWKF